MTTKQRHSLLIQHCPTVVDMQGEQRVAAKPIDSLEFVYTGES